jgi:nucleoside recognition membrane protein YjiH
MSEGLVSAGFLFWAQGPQIAGMTATQKKLRRRIFPLFFCPNAERL